MATIEITPKEETEDGWKFLVEVGGNGSRTEHVVTLEKTYYKELTESRIGPEEFIKQSFEFLLERESRESILREFDVCVISRYFPDYEEEMKRCIQ